MIIGSWLEGDARLQVIPQGIHKQLGFCSRKEEAPILDAEAHFDVVVHCHAELEKAEDAV